MSVPDPRPPYVDPTELATLLGVVPDDPRVARVCAAATRVVDTYYGAATVTEKLAAPPWPDAVAEAALTIAADLWRRPATPGGYFQITDFVGRLALDPAAPVAVLLDSVGRLEWPVS